MSDVVIEDNVDGITINETLIKMEPDEMAVDPHLLENTGNFVTVLVPENFGNEEDVKPDTCSKCSSVIPGKVVKTVNGVLICQKCRTSSQSNSSISSNQSKKSLFNAIVHSKTPLPFRCHYCSKVYESKELFYGHIRQHAAKKKNPYLCGMCGKNFKELIQFKKHICARNVLKCNRCSKQFESIFRLENHYLIHSKYKCEECGKCLSSKTVLEEHKRVHTNEYPFKCAVCNRQFRQKSKYNGHLFVCKSTKPTQTVQPVKVSAPVKTYSPAEITQVKTYPAAATQAFNVAQTIPLKSYSARPVQQVATIVLE